MTVALSRSYASHYFLRTVDWYLSLIRVVPHIGEVHKNNMLKIAMVNVWCLEWFNFSDATCFLFEKVGSLHTARKIECATTLALCTSTW